VREKMKAAGMDVISEMRGSLSKTLQALEPFIHPLVVKARLEGGRDRRSGQ
jgi:3-deoxy-D-manno-octulosonic-acid transferase